MIPRLNKCTSHLRPDLATSGLTMQLPVVASLLSVMAGHGLLQPQGTIIFQRHDKRVNFANENPLPQCKITTPPNPIPNRNMTTSGSPAGATTDLDHRPLRST
ncbi:hypothetical protein EV426DRAFT_574722 [Tirmania nivea]|nr:hypothetical protein EV426DRAFT_574722 [Tirmania nivea]